MSEDCFECGFGDTLQHLEKLLDWFLDARSEVLRTRILIVRAMCRGSDTFNHEAIAIKVGTTRQAVTDQFVAFQKEFGYCPRSKHESHKEALSKSITRRRGLRSSSRVGKAKKD